MTIVAAEEPANANLKDEDHMEDNVDIDMDKHNVSDHEHIFNSVNCILVICCICVYILAMSSTSSIIMFI